MRTRWFRRGLWLVGFGCLWLNVLDDPPLWTEPYLQDVSGDGATVVKNVVLSPDALTQVYAAADPAADTALADFVAVAEAATQ